MNLKQIKYPAGSVMDVAVLNPTEGEEPEGFH